MISQYLYWHICTWDVYLSISIFEAFRKGRLPRPLGCNTRPQEPSTTNGTVSQITLCGNRRWWTNLMIALAVFSKAPKRLNHTTLKINVMRNLLEIPDHYALLTVYSAPLHETSITWAHSLFAMFSPWWRLTFNSIVDYIMVKWLIMWSLLDNGFRQLSILYWKVLQETI